MNNRKQRTLRIYSRFTPTIVAPGMPEIIGITVPSAIVVENVDQFRTFQPEHDAILEGLLRGPGSEQLAGTAAGWIGGQFRRRSGLGCADPVRRDW